MCVCVCVCVWLLLKHWKPFGFSVKYVSFFLLHSTVRLLSKSSVYEDQAVKKSACVKAYNS